MKRIFRIFKWVVLPIVALVLILMSTGDKSPSLKGANPVAVNKTLKKVKPGKGVLGKILRDITPKPIIYW